MCAAPWRVQWSGPAELCSEGTVWIGRTRPYRANQRETRPIDRHSFALSLCVEEGVIPCNFRAHPSNSQLVNNGLAIRERIQIAVQSVCEDRLKPILN